MIRMCSLNLYLLLAMSTNTKVNVFMGRETYVSECHKTAILISDIVNSTEFEDEIIQVRSYIFNGKGFFEPSDNLHEDVNFISQLRQYKESDKKVEWKMHLKEDLMHKLDQIVSNSMRWLCANKSYSYDIDIIRLLYAAVCFKLCNTRNLLELSSIVQKFYAEIDELNNPLMPSDDCSVTGILKLYSKQLDELFKQWYNEMADIKKTIAEILKEYNDGTKNRKTKFKFDHINANKPVYLYIHYLQIVLYHQNLYDIFSRVSQPPKECIDSAHLNALFVYTQTSIQFAYFGLKLFAKEIEKYFAIVNENGLHKRSKAEIPELIDRIGMENKIIYDGMSELICYYNKALETHKGLDGDCEKQFIEFENIRSLILCLIERIKVML